MPTNNVNTYGDISPRKAVQSAKQMLKRGQEISVTERFGQYDPQEMNSSLTRKWRRYEALAPATAPLAEAITPDGKPLTCTDVSVTLQQYGDLVKISDVILDTHEDPVMDNISGICGEQIVDTVELLRIAVMKAGTNVFYAGTATTRATVNAPPSRGDFRLIERAFKRSKAREISSIIKPGPNISTEPVAPAYFALGHTDLSSDIRSMSGFVPVEQYSNPDKSIPGEIGKCEKTRFVLTSNFSPWSAAGVAGTTYLSGGAAVSSATACDVYPIIVIAKDAYGIVPLSGKRAVKPAVWNPKPTPSDPLGQRGFVSWKTYQASVILNQSWIARLECACTANPS